MSRSTPFDPLNRDHQARLELTQPAAPRWIQWWLVVGFALTVGSVTLGEWVLSPPSSPIGLAELTTAAHEGPWALNRALLAARDRFEGELDERSLVAATLAPWIQWAQVSLGAGDHQVRLGHDGWLFFRPAVEWVTGPPFLDDSVLARRRRGQESWKVPLRPDPRPAILGFHRELNERGIELVLLLVPTKAEVHPQRLSPRTPQSAAPLRNPSWSKFLQELSAAGVRTVDPAPAFAIGAERDGRPRFLARDTHWTPEAVEEAAALVGESLADVGFAAPRETGWSRSDSAVSHTGDLTAMLGLPEGRQPWPPQSVITHSVSDPQGQPWQSRGDAEILLLGDSFSNVYSTPDLGWGVGAGLAEQLSWTLEREVDRIAINAGGASGARQRLVDAMVRGEDPLEGKRVVIWEVSTRELAAGNWEPIPLPASRSASSSVRSSESPVALGRGLVVWESNRTGAWRLFARPLEGGTVRQVTPDEPGRHHCCPHFSPDGSRVAYLSRSVGADEYPKVEVPGELRLLSTADWSERTVASARSYGWGNRAVVWLDDERLIFVDAEGRTAQLNVVSGETELLVATPRSELGFLLDPSLAFATSASPTFSPYQPRMRAVAERSGLGGCEPYFSSDGRWGYWNAGPGGPIQRIDPATRAVTPLILRDDPRLPAGWRYLYFVMTSRDDRAIAWGASGGEHNHFAADYEIFVAPSDPETLELVGPPRRISNHPATDRYPDVHLDPLKLGYRQMEVPFVARFEAPSSRSLRWQLNGREVGVGPNLEYNFETAGTYQVAAVGDDGESIAGIVVAEPARAPQVTRTRMRDGGRRLDVEFDEALVAAQGEIETDPAGLATEWRLVEGDRAVQITLSKEVEEGLRVRLSGFTDAAQRPNPLPEEWVEVVPANWPTTEKDLLFAWEHEGAPNLVFDPELDAERASVLVASGRAYPNRNHAMVLDGGAARAGDEDGRRIADRIEATLEFAVELLFSPVAALPGQGEPPGGRLLALNPRRGPVLLELSQVGRRLELTMVTSEERKPQPIVLSTVVPGRSHHLVLSYTPGRLLVLLDGEPVDLERQPAGSLGPWRGKDPRLILGSDTASTAWRGAVESLAIWGRHLDEDGMAEAWERARRRVATRGPVASRQLRARLIAKSPVPTLGEISPYRSGLVAFEWQPDDPKSEPVVVVHWGLLDGKRQPVGDLPIGALATLDLEPLAEQPQLEPYYLSDTRTSNRDRRWFAVSTGVDDRP